MTTVLDFSLTFLLIFSPDRWPQLNSSVLFNKIRGGEYFIYMLCKGQGDSIGRCLTKMRPGYSSNSGRHLSEKHGDKMREIEAAEDAEKEVSVQMFWYDIFPKTAPQIIFLTIA